MIQDVDNSQDILDSRDIIERIAELERLKAADTDGDSFDEYDDQDELDALYALAEEAEHAEDWEYGATLIRDSYFEEYGQDLAVDIGYLDGDKEMYDFIDWERWAEHIQQDYFPVEFDGVTYWVR